MDQAKIEKQLLECPLCQEQYNENSRTPRALPCSHPHCSECLKKLLISNSIKCTICRKSHMIDNGDVTTIHKDNTLIYLVGRMGSRETNKCTSCDDGADAVNYCEEEECNEYLCASCTNAHKRVKLTKSHKLRSLQSPPPRSEPTETRKNRSELNDNNVKLDVFCKTCNKPVARKNHAHQDLYDLNDVVKEKKAKLQSLVSEIDCIDIKDKTSKISQLMNKYKEDNKQLKVVVDQKMEEYKKVFESRYASLLEEAESKIVDKIEHLMSTATIFRSILERMGPTLTEASHLVDNNDKIGFLQNCDGLLGRLTEIYDVISKPVRMKELYFIRTCTSHNFEQIVNELVLLVECELGTDILGAPCVTNGNTNVQQTSSASNEVSGGDANLQDIQPEPFMNVLKSLLDDEPVHGNERLLEASGGAEVDNQCHNTTNDNDDDKVETVILKDLKELPDGYKTVKECIPRGKLEVINTNTVRQMVKNRFETFKLDGKWTIDGDIVTVCSTTLTDAETCMEILVESVLEEIIPLPAGSEIIVDTDKWVMLKSRLNKKYKDQVKVQVLNDENCVGVYATCTSALKDACDNVHIFLRDNLIKSITLEFSLEHGEKIIKFIFRQKSRLKKIHESCSQYFVSVCQMGSNKILIKGIGFGLCMAVDMVYKIGIKCRYYNDDDEEERFSDNDENDDGTDDRFSDDDDNGGAAAAGGNAFMYGDLPVSMNLLIANVPMYMKSLCFHGDDKVIFVVKGDITTLPVEAVVNPSNQSLKHDGGVSRALVQKGGKSIQEECRNFVDRNGKVPVGSIYCSRAGKLPFSFLVHAVGPKWIDGTRQEKKELGDLVIKCLHEASRKQLASIALPAMGTGANMYPISESTDTVVDAIKRFLTENPRTSLHEIYLCHVSMDIVKEFGYALDQNYSEKDIVSSCLDVIPDSVSSATAVIPSGRDAVMRNLFM
ncbi:ADP-D-ribose binding [Mactra antiquata]